jgi:phage gpG-like protein
MIEVDIPARPFLGLSDYDRDSVLDKVRQFLELN